MKRRRTNDVSRPGQNDQVSKTRLKALVRQQVANELKAQDELKTYDVIYSTTASSAGQVLAVTSGIARGNLSSQRQGAQILVKYCQFRMWMSTNTTDIDDTVRVILFQWSDDTTPTTAAVASTDILADIGTNPFLSAISRDNGRRMRILHDSMQTMSENGDFAKTLKVFSKVNSKASWKFNSTNPENGQIYCAVISDSAAIPHPAIKVNFRVRFTDS